MESETPEQLAWRKEFDSWPESKLRMFSEPSTTSMGYDAHQAFARAVLAERETDKRDAREEETLRIARWANRIAISAAIIAAISIITTISITVFIGKP